VNLPNGKHVVIALTYIYGIGRTTSSEILKELKIEETLKIETLSEDVLDRIRDQIKEHIVE
jgi:small subunit ribosomal protein S13